MRAKKEYLLVDGYNIIFAWEKLRQIADSSLEDARIKLLDILCDFQGYTDVEVIAVFDAHLVGKGIGSAESYNNISVVFTKEAETADAYIERTARRLTRNYNVRVATSDALEQVIILGIGAIRLSAADLEREIATAKKSMRESYIDKKPVKNNQLLELLDEETVEILERMRRQKE